MTLTWQIVRKDLFRFRWLLLAWALVLVVKNALFIYASGVFGAPDLAWLAVLESYQIWILLSGCQPLLVFFFVAAIVFEDPPAYRDAFWITRPVSGLRLLAAKLLAATLAFVVVPVLLSAVWWLACGLPLESILSLAANLALGYFAVVIIGTGVAAATGSYPRHLLWTLVGAIAFIVAHFSVRMLAGRDVSSALNNHRYQLLLLVTALLVAAWLAWHQYRTRYFRWSFLLPPAILMTASVTLFSTDWFSIRQQNGWSDRPLQHGSPQIAVTLTGRPAAKSNGLLVPFKWDLAPGAAIIAGGVDLTFHAVDGRSWKVSGSLRNEASFRRAVRHVLGLPSPPEPKEVVTRVSLERQVASRIAADATSVDATFHPWYDQVAIRAEMPLRDSTARYYDGSCSLTDVKITRGRLEANLTMRGSMTELQQFSSAVGLVNRRTGEFVRPEVSRWLNQVYQPILGSALVNPIHLVFKVPAEPGLRPRSLDWFNDTSLVLIGTAGTQPVRLTASLEFSTLPAPPAQDPSFIWPVVRRAPETLLRYAGDYKSAPGVTITITARPNSLELQAPDLPKLMLFAASDSEFYSRTWDPSTDPMDNARFEFVSDSSGRVTHFVLHHDGRDYTIRKLR